MKVIKRNRWMLQLYWPTFWTGRSTYGIQLPSSIIFTTYNDGSRAFGFSILGLGLGVAHGVPASDGDTFSTKDAEGSP